MLPILTLCIINSKINCSQLAEVKCVTVLQERITGDVFIESNWFIGLSIANQTSVSSIAKPKQTKWQATL